MLGAVDMGSNSFRLHIGRYENGEIHVVKSAREPNRLAAGLDKNGFLTEEAISRGAQALGRLRSVLNAYPLSAVRAVATNTLRVARNASQFLQAAEKALGYPIEVISGEEEGRLIYIGVANVLADSKEHRLVIDIGGGSTELILGKGEEIDHVESFSIGTVKQSQSFFPNEMITRQGFDAAILSARSRFVDAAHFYHAQDWTHTYGSSGTIRAIAEIIARNGIGRGDLSLVSLNELRESMTGFGRIDAMKYAGLKPERASSLVGGLAILIGLYQELGIEMAMPVEAGLRMGVMWDLYLQSTLRDRREQAVKEFMNRFHADPMRANRVAEDALALYLAMKPESEWYGKHLYWSALLHETGLFISPTNYHKHGAYLVENADLAGFTSREQQKMSRLILGQKGNLRKLNGMLTDADGVKAVLALRLAVLFMHAKETVDVKMMRMKVKNRVDLEFRKNWLAGRPTLGWLLEKESDWWDEVGIEFVVRSDERN